MDMTLYSTIRLLALKGLLHVFYAFCLCASFILIALTPA